MLSSFCSKDPGTPLCSESESSTLSGSPPQSAFMSDSTPLVVSHIENLHQRGALESTSILTNFRRLLLGTSSFQFRRLQDADVEEDTHTVVTYISVGASTPLQQRHMNCSGLVRLGGPKLEVVPRLLDNPITRQRQKSPKKRHVSWKDIESGTLLQKENMVNRHSLYIPSVNEQNKRDDQERARRRHSYTEMNENQLQSLFPSSLPNMAKLQPSVKKTEQFPQVPQETNRETNYEDDDASKKARYKVQLRHFRRKRRYSDWFFTLYEFDKPSNPEESLALDSHIFETIISRLHGIYALSLNSVFDPNNDQKPPARLCFERLHKVSIPSAITSTEAPPPPRRRQPRRSSRQKQRRCLSRFVESSTSSSRCISCISFGMFDSTSPCNPGHLFCPERELRSHVCSGCGRNMTSGSSLVSVAGSSESGLGKRQEMCYSMTRSVEFYKLTKTVNLHQGNENQAPKNRHRLCASSRVPMKANAALGVPKRSQSHRLRGTTSAPPARLREASLTPPPQLTFPPPSNPRILQSHRKAEKPSTQQHQQQTSSSSREKRKKVRRVLHKRMSQQRVSDWLIATHGEQTDPFTPPLIVF